MPEIYENDCYLKHLWGARNLQRPGGTTKKYRTTVICRVVHYLWNTTTQTHTKILRMNQVNKHKPIRNNKNDYSPRYQMDVLDTG